MTNALLVYYHPINRYSWNAVLGALEGQNALSATEITLARNHEEMYEKLQKLLSCSDKVFVAISIGTLQFHDTGILLQNLIQRFGKRPYYIAGGPHTTGKPSEVLALGFDVVVMGEGELSFPQVLLHLQNGQSLINIHGIAFYNNGNITINNPSIYCNLDDFWPFPKKVCVGGPLEITRGCPNMCSFCQTPYLFGTKPRHRSIEVICDIVKKLVRDGLKDLRYVTPNILSYGSPDGRTIALENMEELFSKVQEILGQGRQFLGTFPSEVRPEFIQPKTIALLKKFSANNNLTIGGQSGSQRMLTHCHRGHTVEDIYSAVMYAHSVGFRTNVDFIFGLPDETEEDVQASLDMMEKLIKMGSKIHAHTFMPLPQTPFEHCPPPSIRKYRAKVERFVSQGNIFGQWKHQDRKNREQKNSQHKDNI